MSVRFHVFQRRHTKSAKMMWSKGEERRGSVVTTLFRTQKCEIVFPVQDRGPENDTLTGGTSLYRKYRGVPSLGRTQPTLELEYVRSSVPCWFRGLQFCGSQSDNSTQLSLPWVRGFSPASTLGPDCKECRSATAQLPQGQLLHNASSSVGKSGISTFSHPFQREVHWWVSENW